MANVCVTVLNKDGESVKYNNVTLLELRAYDDRNSVLLIDGCNENGDKIETKFEIWQISDLMIEELN